MKVREGDETSHLSGHMGAANCCEDRVESEGHFTCSGGGEIISGARFCAENFFCGTVGGPLGGGNFNLSSTKR